MDKIVGGYDRAGEGDFFLDLNLGLNFLMEEIINKKNIIIYCENVVDLLNIKLLIINSLISIILLIYIKDKRICKNVGLFFSFINLIVMLNLYIKYDYLKGGYQFIEKINIMNYLNIELGVDSISIIFILLSIILIIICILLVGYVDYKVNYNLQILKIII